MLCTQYVLLIITMHTIQSSFNNVCHECCRDKFIYNIFDRTAMCNVKKDWFLHSFRFFFVQTIFYQLLAANTVLIQFSAVLEAILLWEIRLWIVFSFVMFRCIWLLLVSAQCVRSNTLGEHFAAKDSIKLGKKKTLFNFDQKELFLLTTHTIRFTHFDWCTTTARRWSHILWRIFTQSVHDKHNQRPEFHRQGIRFCDTSSPFLFLQCNVVVQQNHRTEFVWKWHRSGLHVVSIARPSTGRVPAQLQLFHVR